ncbi:MAG: glycosyltransferase [Solumvirus sp.]|uniref:Glycosyltransferase n=1 Tax=Solumvirus sp. TaxID=2487773 RepID=A0A3G5AGI6_9VIRU|nr:MAG: glycosyltransferase [Solumvirus sp.]
MTSIDNSATKALETMILGEKDEKSPKSIKLKLFSPFDNDYHRHWEHRLMSKSKVWTSHGISLTWVHDANEADYHILQNKLGGIGQYNPKKGLQLRMEPDVHYQMYDDYFDKKSNKFIHSFTDHNSIEWHVNQTYDQLKEDIRSDQPCYKKDKLISAIISGHSHRDAYKMRHDFASYLASIKGFDLYGRDKLDLYCYKGSLPYMNKDSGLLPYKYTFASENCVEKGYFTEKIVDAILCECLCFYWGCPNISEFIDERAYIWIDLTKPEEAIKVIRKAIKDDEYSKRLPYIKLAKKKIIDELQIMPSLAKVISELEAKKS